MGDRADAPPFSIPNMEPSSGTLRRDQFRRLTLVFISIGVVLQVANWMYNRSLWNDELAVALNLQHRTFVELARPLDYSQATPIGFLWIEKWMMAALGGSERALRLFPLLCGLASLFLAGIYFRLWMTPTERILALALLVIQPRLVEFSAEVKPYACDVAATLLVLLIEFQLRQSPIRRGWLAAFAAAGVVLPWISFPVIFVLAITGLSAIYARMRPLHWRGLFLVACALACCVLSATAQFKLLRATTQNTYLAAFWADYVLPRNGPRSVGIWVLSSWINLFRSPFKGTSEWVAAPIAALGLIVLIVRHRRSGLVLAGLLLIAVAAAAIRLYPFGDRLALYLTPMLAAWIAASLAVLAESRTAAWRAAALVLLIFVLADAVGRSGGDLLRPADREDSRKVLGQLASRAMPNDAVYVFFYSRLSYNYYAPRLGLRLTPTMGGTVEPADDPQLNRLLAGRRVWIYFAHGSQTPDADMQDRFIKYADSKAAAVDSIRALGAGAFLFKPTPLTTNSSTIN